MQLRTRYSNIMKEKVKNTFILYVKYNTDKMGHLNKFITNIPEEKRQTV